MAWRDVRVALSGLTRRGVWLLLAVNAACASIPKHQYGIDTIVWSGMRAMEPEALATCLATRERENLTLRLGFAAPECREPPFTSTAPTLELWSWPWTRWPVFDPAIFNVDRARILRWYRARGFYGARIIDVRTEADGQLVEGARCPTLSDAECKLRLHIQISEGAPIQISALTVESHGRLPAALLASLRASLEQQTGSRFDEALYMADKARLKAMLARASYAAATVEGRVVISRAQHTARIAYTIEPGPRCVFGQLRVQGAEDLPHAPIVQAAAIPRGERFDQAVIDDAERAIFALGVFSAVRVDTHVSGRVVDLVAVVQRARVTSWQTGVGVLSGSLTRVTSDETYSVPQWDVHVRLRYENKNLFGGLRKFQLEDRPALILLDNFPGIPADGPRLGNVLSARFEQPGFIEARTRLNATAAWDLGPDPFRGFFRHDVGVKLGLERSFLENLLTSRLAIQHDIFDVIDREPVPSDVTDYRLPFLEQQLIVDARVRPERPRLGAYFAITLQEAFRLGGYGSWNYLRIVSDLRGYVPVFWDVVLAARIALGALIVTSASPGLTGPSAMLGPQVYRLRGGGANGNRGFAAGQLGDGIEGGTRRWEASLEARVPLGGNFGFVLFGDAGDLHREPSFRFDHVNVALGFGLRYFSVLGALRFDAGWRVPGLQTIGGAAAPPLSSGVLPSAVHLTIGEAF